MLSSTVVPANRCARRVSKCFERHVRVGFGNTLAENAGNAATDVMHDKPRRPHVLNDVLEQLLHGGRFACIAGVTAHAMLFLKGLKDRFFGIPGRDADAHAVFLNEPGATCADAGPTPDNECNVLNGRFGIAFIGLCHVACSDDCGGQEGFWRYLCRSISSVISLCTTVRPGEALLCCLDGGTGPPAACESTPLLHLDNDLPLGPPLLEIRKRLLRLFEWKYLIDHRPDAPRLEKLSDLCELAAVWMHEQE